MLSKSDKAWEKYGGLDPYYGVLSEDQFQKTKLSKVGLDRFFETGKTHIEQILGILESMYGTQERLRALDFGCGVGRLVIPLAEKFKEVVGVDVSESMLREARQNCGLLGVGNAVFELSNDSLERLHGNFQFINSFIVFQHIPPSRGEKIFEKMLDFLAPGGFAAVQFCYHVELAGEAAFNRKVLKMFPWVHIILNVLKKRPLFYPMMEMNTYDCSRLLAILQRKGIQQVRLDFTNHDGYWGAMFYFRKEKTEP